MKAAARLPILGFSMALAVSCSSNDNAGGGNGGADSAVAARLATYSPVTLQSDLAESLSAEDRAMIPLLIEAAREMDAIYKQQAYGNLDSLIAVHEDVATRRFIEINYGPWDRLAGNAPFLPGVGAKPLGANFYPADIRKEEFDSAAKDPSSPLRSLYTVVRRDSAGRLTAVPYHVAFATHVQNASAKLREAAALSKDAGLKKYLELRAQALLNDEYRESDMAWLDMKTNAIEVVIGPIEVYEDALNEMKAANEAFVLIKDREWSARLSRYAALLPELQRGLPVPAVYKSETPGTDSDLNAYDAIYYAGDANAGAKTIAINLPNDEEVQLKKGTRRLQLKNTMRAKFDRILVPIASELIVEDQRKHVTFDAFFSNVMFHEVAHGLGIKNTVNGRGLVRDALKEQSSALEEGKADILGLYMVTALTDRGELTAGSLMDNYVTFVAGIMRSVRFGAASAHGRANMAAFNFFSERGAFSRDSASGAYRVDSTKTREAMAALSERILRYQGEGDYDGVVSFMKEKGSIPAQLATDLELLKRRNIPVDIVFDQTRKW